MAPYATSCSCAAMNIGHRPPRSCCGISTMPAPTPLRSRPVFSARRFPYRPTVASRGRSSGTGVGRARGCGLAYLRQTAAALSGRPELIFESPLIGEQSLELPAPQPLLLPALGETLPVYGGEIKAHGKVGIKWSPPMPAPFLLALGKTIEPGVYKIGGTLRFQACSDDVCEPPQEIKFELPLELEAGIPPAPKKPA